jgi:hypothetical protein
LRETIHAGRDCTTQSATPDAAAGKDDYGILIHQINGHNGFVSASPAWPPPACLALRALPVRIGGFFLLAPVWRMNALPHRLCAVRQLRVLRQNE